MWILIITKLPTQPSPPKLSIHWSKEDGRTDHAQEQRAALKAPPGSRENRAQIAYIEESSPDDELFLDAFDMGVPNWIKARSIIYQDQAIRLFPHEYKILEPSHMRDYVFGMDGEEIPSHELVPGNQADAALLGQIKDEDQRSYYDAALIDGCIHEQALLTALGVDLFATGADIPPIGWYRCKPEYAQIYCHPWEMEEAA